MIPLVSETLEIRWFLPEVNPASVFDVFRSASGREPNPETPRTDRYLRLPHSENIGVKIREGRIEHKWLIDRLPAHSNCVASYGLWRKSSLALRLSDEETGSDDWIPIQKQRWFSLWTWRIDRAASVSHRDETRETRCDLELARLDFNAPFAKGEEVPTSTPVWSLCFESEGPHRIQLQNAVIERCFDAGFAGLLENATLMDYPGWLRRIHSPQSAHLG